MMNIRELVASRFDVLKESSQNKVMPLAEAVERFVRPGMKINPAGRPCAAVFELCRRFQGTRPRFEYVSSNLSSTMLPLVHLKLIEKAVTSFAGDGYPTPGPSPVIVRALDRGELELENWSMLTIVQRMAAGALGVPFTTTRSLIGSSLGAELPHAFREIEDPFAEGGVTGIIKAYNPDVSFVHAWAADPSGNAIMFPPLSENVYGALGARTGIIVTAEHIVDSEFIRKHANLGRIPFEKVLSVSRVPYGAHPSGIYARNVPELAAYGNDYEFWREHRLAQKNEADYDRWVREWILDIPDQEAYLKKLGAERINRIHFAAERESWRPDLESSAENLKDKPAGAIERMVIRASKEIAARIHANGYRTVLCGIGQATLAAIQAWHALRDRGYEFGLMAELGFYNYDPRPADSYVFNFRNIPAATMLSDILDILGIQMGGATNRCMGVIGAAQIDRRGNVNSVRMNGKFIIGSGGANDIATAARETLVVAQQNKGQFVKDVEHITCPGRNIRCVVTTKGRFEKGDGDELILTGYMAEQDRSEEESIRLIRDLVDWDLKVSSSPERLEAPGADELLLLRSYDPERFFIGKAEKKAD
jgi:acyl CoA:acetate/3-ketoacid CoA transferase alpha subunit